LSGFGSLLGNSFFSGWSKIPLPAPTRLREARFIRQASTERGKGLPLFFAKEGDCVMSFFRKRAKYITAGPPYGFELG